MSTPANRKLASGGKVMISTIRDSVDADDLSQLNEVAKANLSCATECCVLELPPSAIYGVEKYRMRSPPPSGGSRCCARQGLWGNYIYGASGVVEVFLACWQWRKTPLKSG